MRTLEMTWNKEKGRLVCRWVACRQQGGPLSAANVPGMAVVSAQSPSFSGPGGLPGGSTCARFGQMGARHFAATWESANS